MPRNIESFRRNQENDIISKIDAKRRRQQEELNAPSKQPEAAQEPEEDDSENTYPNAYKPSNRDAQIDAGNQEARGSTYLRNKPDRKRMKRKK